MTKLFTSLSIAFLSLTLNSSVSMACPASTLKIHDLVLNANGAVTRYATVIKESDAQRPDAPTKYAYSVRDTLKLERGDQVTLNAGLNMIDASVFVTLSLKSQKRDSKGIFSSTFLVKELMISEFGFPQPPVEKNYTAKIVSNYAGDGTYSKGCGEVIKMDVDCEK